MIATGRLLLVLTIVGALQAGCGDDDGERAASTTSVTTSTATADDEPAVRCSGVVEEPLDHNAGHVLPGAPEPTYQTDPPTSGAHQAGPAITGMVTEPLSRPVQVGQLEIGQVLLQHRDLTPAELEELATLAGEHVIVAPNPSLPDRVVATAWQHKVTCDGVDLIALDVFRLEYAGATAHEAH